METRGDVNAESQARKRKATEEAAMDDVLEDGEEDMEEEEEEGVNPVVVMEGSKHGDGSLYKPKVDVFRWLYSLEETGETSMEPMRLTLPTTECLPTSTACGRHVGGPMLQIFSIKVAKLPRAAASGPIQLYGFMAVRDLMDPLCNHVFNHTRDDPFVIQDLHSDPFIYLPGPKKGVNMQARVLFEYDVRIMGGEEEWRDLPLIDGVAIFSERTCINAPASYRIKGDRGGAVDI
ncbi:hypothetical protein BAE44_0002149 [Dichanthelium oligosanthes]|uniref:DUF6598 domain-containing protein n=1 Tax=Dichanthelium oligosanthes TaxID=888268 RepID=A0A1E5WHF5_9POAL|nr:hypothetical protein BAE44_0002149 [Dichanthelium oligosanthes]